ncbi:MAG: PilT/PilU family type 4a pilus ATPase [Candidatus Endonucleobacter bathymodioli]|uniref:PilT/PilU family type 4a pilus ATPase n=1 Tax=Candidatus Endonucleibacter bathymodioli TaxID=539814 RepID=A0AA90NM33_9GAMM|nr:PilT/PilU family type 4a pilus ATPase [Candidatus Endonucleobacter bathymodioli]
MNIREALKLLVDKNGSELFVSVKYPLAIKVNDKILAITSNRLTEPEVSAIIEQLLNTADYCRYKETKESNCALNIVGTGRFRMSAFVQKNDPGMVIRRIQSNIPSLSELGMPLHLGDEIFKKKGLILLTGSAGSGKSSTMAALIDHRNINGSGHIIMIEDPVEFIHNHKQCLVTQRDVGLDTNSYEDGISNALRQAPSVLGIGEIRSSAVMAHALSCVETGHLCIATLHANNSYQAIERIIHFFPKEQREQVLMDLSLNLVAIVGQQLIESENGDRLHPAVELMLTSPRIADLIKRGKIDELHEAIGKSGDQGMQTFDQSLYDLYKTGKISYDKALLHATSSNNLRLQIKLNCGNPSDGSSGQNMDKLTISKD